MFRVLQHHFPAHALVELVADGVMCFLAILLAVATAAAVPLALDRSLESLSLSHVLLPAIGFTAVILLNYVFVGLYKQRSVATGHSALYGRALIAVLMGVPVAYMFVSRSLVEGAGAFIVTGLATVYLMLGIVLVRGVAFSAARTSVGSKRILIVGTGSDAQRVAADLRARDREDHVVVGFVPTAAAGAETARPGVFPFGKALDEICAEHHVDEIIVAAREQRGGGVPMDQLLACRIRGVPVMDLSAFYERTRGEVPIDTLKASWLVYGHGFVQDRLRIVVKRLFDIGASLTLLLVASPIMLVAALAVWLDSNGPIIYRQERVGLGGRRFMCLKFRSMRVDAEKDGVARWATKNDSRITRVGAFMRKTRIDELPQLFSVLRGEMSMVGPRPERPSFVEQLKDQIPYYDIRHSVKPGVTGWAQVRFSYGASIEDARRKHQFDLYYVKNNSLLLDLLILIETVSVVIFREGAH